MSGQIAVSLPAKFPGFMNTEKRLFLLDAMALIYRAYYALNKNPRISSKGVNTSAVMGFANTLYDVLLREKPDYIAVATDMAAPTLRHLEYSEYKAQREAMPDALSQSIPLIYQLIEAFNIPLLGIEGYEADDLIGTLAMQAANQGYDVFMMTADKDFGQLVTDKIKIYKPARMGNGAEVLGVDEVCEKFGIKHPTQLVDILGIWGDASDNIKGIPGLGEVAARALIAQFGSIENMIANVDSIEKEGWRKKVIENADQALASKHLARIITDAPVNFDADAFRYSQPDREKLKNLLHELEFKTFADRIFSGPLFAQDASDKQEKEVQGDLFSTADKSSNIQSIEHEYRLIEKVEDRMHLLGLLRRSSAFCFDTETTGLNPHEAELVGISFAVVQGQAYYIAVPESYIETLALLAEFKDVFENPEILKIGHNLKYDITILRYYDIDVNGALFDTMIAHYLLEPDQRHNMDFLSVRYLSYTPVSIESLIGKKGKGQLSMRSLPPAEVKDYACEDADVTLKLLGVLKPLLQKDGLSDLFQNIEMPLVPVLVSMESEGVKLDVRALDEYSLELAQEISELEKEIYTLSGRSFNLNSPKQLGEVLFDEMKLVEKPKKTATGQYSTGEEILQKLAGKHPVIDKMLDYRSLSKLKSTYVDALPLLVSPRTGRLHTSYNQTVTVTGRLSSTNPNLQNIPIRTDKGREIRRAFIPRSDDHVLVSADYSQIELRIIASLSGDSAMIEDFSMGKDIHTATASRIYGITDSEVNSEMRRKAKMVNFGIIYGISAFGLSERMRIPRHEAAEIIEQYFRMYPGIRTFMDQAIEKARENGYVETIMGRRRYLPEIHSANVQMRQFAERNAINAPIQGSAADLIKIAMVKMHQSFLQSAFKSRMILQVHDELVFDVLKSEEEHVRAVIRDIMENAVHLNVPLVIEMSSGRNWLEAH